MPATRIAVAAGAPIAYYALSVFLFVSDRGQFQTRILWGLLAQVAVGSAVVLATARGLLPYRARVFVIAFVVLSGFAITPGAYWMVPLIGAASGVAFAVALSGSQIQMKSSERPMALCAALAVALLTLCIWVLPPRWSVWAVMGLAGLSMGAALVVLVYRRASR